MKSAHSKQLNLGPMNLQSVKSEGLSPLNSVNTGVVLADVILTAGARLGMQKKELAALFELSAPDFTVAFDVNDTKRNRLMKVAIPMALAKQIAIQLCEATGMAIAGPDLERNALADLLASAANYIRVHQR